MKFRHLHSCVKLLATLIVAAGIHSRSCGQTAAETGGQELAAQLRDRSPMQDFSGEGILKYRYRQERVEIPVVLRIVNEGKLWKSLYEARATNGALMEKLEIAHPPDQPGLYVLTLLDATGHSLGAKTIASEQNGVPFAGTDFWLCDLGLDFFQWPSQTLVKKEMRKGRSCRVLESIPANPDKSPYARVRSWIDLETHGLIRAEAYDSHQKLVKEFEILKIAKIDGKIQLKEMEIRSPVKGSRTRLEFVFDVKEAP
jgi:hypothetical protein